LSLIVVEDITMKTLIYITVLVVLGVVFLSGCGPIDPEMCWERYKGEKPGGDVKVVALTHSVYGREGVWYPEYPTIRITEKNGRVWELEADDKAPSTWRLWTWMPGELRAEVPWEMSARVSRWEHPEPPWELVQTKAEIRKAVVGGQIPK
jgi:hypothetical protein